MLGLKDKSLTINDRMGKVSLHTLAGKEAVLRVRLLPDGTLETLGRVYGGAWDTSSVKAHPQLLENIRLFLVKTATDGYYYINQDNLAIVDRRYQRSVKKA